MSATARTYSMSALVFYLYILLYMCALTTLYVSAIYMYAHTTSSVSTRAHPHIQHERSLFFFLLYMCPHTAIFVSARARTYRRRGRIIIITLLYMCPHTTVYVSSYYRICVLILLYMCPHTSVYVSSNYARAPVRAHRYEDKAWGHIYSSMMTQYSSMRTNVSSNYARAPVRADQSSTSRVYCYIASSYCYIFVLILLYMCPHTAIYVSP